MMKKDLILYNCFGDECTADDVVQRMSVLSDFASVLGQHDCPAYYERAGGDGRELKKAIAECIRSDGYLLVYDLEALHPNEEDAIGIYKELSEKMIFVMFVDDQSTIKTLAPNLYGG